MPRGRDERMLATAARGMRVTLGVADRQQVLGDPVDAFCQGRLDGTVFGLLARERDRLFPDEMFADLFTTRGRRSVPPSIVASVLVLKQLEGLSDVEAIDRFTYDARWRHACGVGGWDQGLVGFDRTVLVKFRMRLDASDDPRRIFKVTTQVAAEAGLVGVKRVLDSAPLFDAVATQDTVTLIRSAIRGLLKAADAQLESRLRGVLSGTDDYAGAGKPACDWNDAQARAAVVHQLAVDGLALLRDLEDREVPVTVIEAAALVATVIGQDLEQGEDGTFRIARRVAADRVISTVDPETRHGRKSTSGKFDGYKGHVAIDPDSEIITDTAVGPANAGDATMTAALTADLDQHDQHDGDGDGDGDGSGGGGGDPGRPAVYGDAAYGSGDNLADLDARGITPMVKVQPPARRNGMFSKDDFDVDLQAGTVSCPAGQTAPIVRSDDGSGTARFGNRCQSCPLRGSCTTAAKGRSISVHRHEALLAAARVEQQDPAWGDDYRATRPKVERKLAHKLRRSGRRARRRGQARVDADWNLLGGAINLARLTALGVRTINGTWQIAPA